MIPKALLRELKGKKLPTQKRVLPPLNLERQYYEDLKPVLRGIQSVIRYGIVAKLPAWSERFYRNRPELTRQDATDDDIISALETIKGQLDREYTPAEIRALAKKTGQKVSHWNERILKENLKRVMGVDVFIAQPYLTQELSMFTVNNTLLIQSLKENALSAVQKKVWSGFRAGTRWEEIAADIEKYIDPEVGSVASRARLIARDQVSKLNGQLSFLRQSELGINSYIWRTMGDERVRDSHAAKDGQEYDWSSPPADTGHPGEDYNCRCYAEPVLSKLIESPVDTGDDE